MNRRLILRILIHLKEQNKKLEKQLNKNAKFSTL